MIPGTSQSSVVIAIAYAAVIALVVYPALREELGVLCIRADIFTRPGDDQLRRCLASRASNAEISSQKMRSI